jgi:hypothetical protein
MRDEEHDGDADGHEVRRHPRAQQRLEERLGAQRAALDDEPD